MTLFELRARKIGEEAGPLDAVQASGESIEWTTLLIARRQRKQQRLLLANKSDLP